VPIKYPGSTLSAPVRRLRRLPSPTGDVRATLAGPAGRLVGRLRGPRAAAGVASERCSVAACGAWVALVGVLGGHEHGPHGCRDAQDVQGCADRPGQRQQTGCRPHECSLSYLAPPPAEPVGSGTSLFHALRVPHCRYRVPTEPAPSQSDGPLRRSGHEKPLNASTWGTAGRRTTTSVCCKWREGGQASERLGKSPRAPPADFVHSFTCGTHSSTTGKEVQKWERFATRYGSGLLGRRAR